MQVDKREENVNGIKTDVISVQWNPSQHEIANKQAVQIIIFPGNPGVAQLYENFAREIVAKAGPATQAIVVGYAGHRVSGDPLEDDAGGPVWSLDQQVQHKLDFIREILGPKPPGSLRLLIGHSIGSYLALRVMASHNTLNNNNNNNNSNNNSNNN